jgi:hypothetical protein
MFPIIKLYALLEKIVIKIIHKLRIVQEETVIDVLSFFPLLIKKKHSLLDVSRIKPKKNRDLVKLSFIVHFL